ncbi:MAG: prepilin-type N-terminal cleavage/methylation domain-containing protein [Phycisphaeraceae bacterium]|nr:prepilin-type N-terminal cleavage/methylation domain-containing protein [Phycisphaeraceae bacterium]
MNDPRNNMMMADGGWRIADGSLSSAAARHVPPPSWAASRRYGRNAKVHPPSANTHPPFLPAFTLVELLVVVALIGIAMSIALPTMSAMTRDSTRNTAENAVAMAGNIARAYATRPISDVKDVNLSTTTSPSQINASDEAGSYSGCIALFTPANEIRIAGNGTEAQRARASTAVNIGLRSISSMERLYWDGGAILASDWGDPQHPKHLNGFRDVQIDYIRLPADAGVAGVIRDRNSTANDPPRLLAPPFAVWFDAGGNLVAAGNFAANDFIYYDGNYDGRYGINGTGGGPARANDYNPDFWDPTAPKDTTDPNFDVTTHYNTSAKKRELPFERIEAVSAVMVYSKDSFRSEATAGGFYWNDGTSTALDQQRWNWMKENGRMVMFTRQNGLALRGMLDN